MNQRKILIGFIILIFVFQMLAGSRVIFGDDWIFATLAENKTFFYNENAHPPLPVWFDIFFTSIFGVTNTTIRLTSIIFATLTVPLVYIAAKRYTNKNAALIAAILTGASAWHFRASQMNSGSDGGMFTFFFLLTIYVFLRYMEQKERNWLYATAVSFGIVMLTKETGILLIPILALYFIFAEYKRTNTFKLSWIKQGIIAATKIGVISLIVWSVFPITDIAFNNAENTTAIISRINDAVITQEDAPTHSFGLLWVNNMFKNIFWVGPILGFLPLLWLWNRLREQDKASNKSNKQREENYIHAMTIAIVMIFYTIIIPPHLDQTRYLMVMIPSLAILCGIVIERTIRQITKKELFYCVAMTTIIFATFMYLNVDVPMYSYESNNNPIVQMKQANFSFAIPLFNATDNSGFIINFMTFLVTFIVSAILFLSIAATKSKEKQRALLLMLICFGAAFNFIVLEEYTLHITSPDYSDAIKELVRYAKENKLEEPLYVLKNYEFQYYLREEYTEYNKKYGLSDTDPKEIEAFEQEISQNGGTIIFTDMPFVAKDGDLWKTITSCRKDKEVTDKGVSIGYVFTC